jgi:Tfp pilus assembly protein PilO
MKNRTNRAALFALIAVFACVLIAAGAGLYHVKSKRLQALKQTLLQKQDQVEEVRAEVKRLPNLEAAYEELHARVSVLEPNLPTEAYIPTFLSQVQTLAGETNNHLTLIKPKPKRKLPAASPAPEKDVVASGKSSSKPAALQGAQEVVESPYDEIGIEVGFDGTYWSALALLERLRAFPKMIAVNDITMKPKSACTAVSSQPLLEVTLHLTAVMAKEK